MLESLTAESFSKYLNDAFLVHVEENMTVEIELTEVKLLPAHTPPPSVAGNPDIKFREQPFSILFRGPSDVQLIQRMYRFEHDSIGVIEKLFITPVGADAEGVYYEAVFN